MDDEDRLGPVVRDFPPPRPSELYREFLTAGWGALAIGAVGTIALIAITDAHSVGALVARALGWLGLVGFGVASLIRLGVVPQTHITVHEQGLRFELAGVKPKLLRWDELTLRHETTRRLLAPQRLLEPPTVIDSKSQLRVTARRGGFELVLDERLRDFDALTATIQQVTCERMVADVMAALAQGRGVDIGGGMRIEVDGLHRADEVARWSTIKTIDVRDDHFHVGPFVCPADEIGNVYAVAEVMQRLVERERTASAYR
jgi:hypothetical protein